MSLLDHLLRAYPSRQYTQIKKSFFSRGQTRFSLGNGIEAFKGVFASMRIVHTTNGPALSVNVDVANGTFFTTMPLPDMARELTRARNVQDLSNMFVQAKRNWHTSSMYRMLKCLTHVTVIKRHMPGKNGENAPEFKIHRFHKKDPWEVTFKEKTFDAAGNQTGEKTVTVAEYFMRKYQIQCARNLPTVELTKKVPLSRSQPGDAITDKRQGEMCPMEVLIIPENQRYRMKLDEKQTSNVS
jgi:eukaryotic translation initiation factor 2C